MFDPTLPLPIRLLSLFHVAMPVLLLWGIRRLGYDPRGWVLQTLFAWLLLPVCFLFGPGKNLNWTWGPFDTPQHVLSSEAYLAVCLIGYPLLLYWPTHLVLRRLFRSAPRPYPPEGAASGVASGLASSRPAAKNR